MEKTVDIDKYVQSLRRDLCEAMKLAQSLQKNNNVDRQKCITKRSKGQPVDIGQRVYLATKVKEEKRNWQIVGRVQFT